MTITDKIVAAYIDGMKARYGWARGENGEAIQQRGLTMGEDAARKACAGLIKLDGDAWLAALDSVGFKGHYTMKTLKAFCEGSAQ
jgi:hypothetical protein